MFFDTTSTSFEVDEPDASDDERDAVPVADGEAPETPLPGGFRRCGHSKDHRPDLPQVVIGLAVTRRGCRCAAGCGLVSRRISA